MPLMLHSTSFNLLFAQVVSIAADCSLMGANWNRDSTKELFLHSIEYNQRNHTSSSIRRTLE
jgi:hypothetical protein